MRLLRGVLETPVAHPGMSVGEALRICVDCGTPGIPYADANGLISGRFSVRHVFLVSSIPSDMVQGAHLIGHEAAHLELPSEHFRAVFGRTVDAMILPEVVRLGSGAQVTKAMALMEKFDTSYLFVIDDGQYRGVVTRLSLTRVLLDERD